MSALVVPHWENLRRALAQQGAAVDHEAQDTLVRHPAVQALLRKRIDRVLKDVSKSEQIKKFMILPHAFTMAADELTVSLKLRRNVVLKKYASQLDALYKEGRDAVDDD